MAVSWLLDGYSWKLTEAPVTRVVAVMMAIQRSSLTLNQTSLFQLDLVSSTATSKASTTLCVTSRTYKPSIQALSETWLDTSTVDAELTIKGYSLYCKDRNRHGGGVAVYLKSLLTTQPIGNFITPTSESSLESLWIAVSSPTLPSSIALCVCYLTTPPLLQ